MTNTLPTTLHAALLSALAVCLGAHAATPAPTQRALADGLRRYLADHGQLCVGKSAWPIQVSAAMVDAGQRDAVQLPVLEQLGLVSGTAAADQSVSYALTDAGKRWYWPRPTSAGAPVRDLCAGTLKLDRVVRWSAPSERDGSMETTVTYTYTMTTAPWTADERAQRVFPMIARVVNGQRTAQLAQRLRLHHGRWEGIAAAE